MTGLDAEGVGRMSQALLGVERVSAPLLDILVDRGEGNPLYVEEILRQLRETGGVQVEAGEAALIRANVTLPETIHDIIAARIDRLPDEVKHTLQVAAVVGRQVAVPLLARAIEAEVELESHLDTLRSSDFLFVSTREPELIYTFKHALTQDVAYSSLLERRRRVYHAAVGRGLEELRAGRVDEVVELLAHHFGKSAEGEKAVDYAILAAEKAQRRWANTEALGSFTSALKRLDTMPDTQPNKLRRIDAVVKQAEIKFALGQHADHIQALEGIRVLVDAVADPRRRAAWYYWTGFLTSLTGASPEVAIDYCREAARIAEASGLDELKAYAECCLSEAYLYTGRLRAALEASEPALKTFEERGNAWWACRTLWGLSAIAIFLGEWERSLEYCRRALEHARAVGDVRMKIVALWRTGWTHVQRGDTVSGQRLCEEALALSPGPFDAAMTKGALGHGLAKAGELDAGTALLAEAVAWFEQSRLRPTWVVFAIWLGDAYIRQGKLVEARRILEEVVATTHELGYRHLEGSGQRLLGETFIPDDPAAATDHLEAALKMLLEVGAQNEVAKTLVAQARLRRARANDAEARALLEQALALFERLGTVDGPRRVRATLAVLDGRGPKLVIVSGSQRGLCQELARDLQGIDDVNVVLDRREDGRHMTKGPPGPDERHADRRSRSEAGTAIQAAGFVVVARDREA